jgi:hypothetical protein
MIEVEQSLYMPEQALSFQEVEAPRFQDSWYMKMVSFFSHMHQLPLSPRKYSYYSNHFFIVPTDANNYKITGMLKTIKIPTIAPTCFGSRRNHHQGAISCF